MDEVRKKSRHIEFGFKKGQRQKGQDKNNKIKGNKIATTNQKWKDPQKHCKHCDVARHMDEKC